MNMFVTPKNGRLSEHFTALEAMCKCGCGKIPDVTLREINILEEYRDMHDSPVIVTSWYRCWKHPIEKAKIRPGTHNKFGAVDCYRPGLTALEQYYLASQIWAFAGIGFYPEWEHPGLHLDFRVTPARWAKMGGEYCPMPNIEQLQALTNNHKLKLLEGT